MGAKDPSSGLTADAFETRVLGFIAFGIVALGIVFCLPPIAQPQSYHAFADGRTMLGLPNFHNVASNLPFAAVGILGLSLLLREGTVRPDSCVMPRGERWPLLVFFVGVLLTAFGSAYYHLHPDNGRLVWDRLPMTVAFMGLFASVIAERTGTRAAKSLLWPLVWLGIVSVFKWHMGEQRNAGDLRLYGFVQFAAGHLTSGHTLKHLAAGMGAYWDLSNGDAAPPDRGHAAEAAAPRLVAVDCSRRLPDAGVTYLADSATAHVSTSRFAAAQA